MITYDSCNMSGFEVTGHSLEKNPLKINFDPDHMNAELPILETGLKYMIIGKTIVCGDNENFTIPDLSFEGKVPEVRCHP